MAGERIFLFQLEFRLEEIKNRYWDEEEEKNLFQP